jgi:hypothetical protein
LHALIVKTVGVVDPIRAALVPIADDIDVALSLAQSRKAVSMVEVTSIFSS